MTPLSLHRVPHDNSLFGYRSPSTTIPPYFDIDDVTVTISLSSINPWQDWFHQMVIEGQSEEKSGALIFFDQSMANELFRWDLSNVGIFAFGQATPLQSWGLLSGLDAALYIEQVAPQS